MKETNPKTSLRSTSESLMNVLILNWLLESAVNGFRISPIVMVINYNGIEVVWMIASPKGEIVQKTYYSSVLEAIFIQHCGLVGKQRTPNSPGNLI